MPAAAEKIVGTVSVSNYPGAAKALPVIGSFNAFSLERIVTLQPDLILMWGSGQRFTGARAVRRVWQCQSMWMSCAHLKTFIAGIRNLGVLTGAATEAEQEATRLEQGFRATARATRRRATV